MCLCGSNDTIKHVKLINLWPWSVPFLSYLKRKSRHQHDNSVSHTIYTQWIVKAALPLLTFSATTASYIQLISVQFSICDRHSVLNFTWIFIPIYGCSSEKAMAPHSNTLAWKIPWIEEPGRLQSMRSLRVGHDWATSLWLFTLCTGEENGNPLQCSCLENPRDGRAWWAAAYGVAQSRTWLMWLSSSSTLNTEDITD